MKITTSSKDGVHTCIFEYSVWDRIKQYFNKIKYYLSPFTANFIKNVSIKRRIKAMLCFYILNRNEFYCIFGNWKKAIFILPIVKDESYYGISYCTKQNGVIELIDGMWGYQDISNKYESEMVVKEESVLLNTDWVGTINGVDYFSKEEFDKVDIENWEIGHKKEIDFFKDIENQYFMMYGHPCYPRTLLYEEATQK